MEYYTSNINKTCNKDKYVIYFKQGSETFLVEEAMKGLHFNKTCTLWCLIEGGLGKSGGGGWKNTQNLTSGGGWNKRGVGKLP